MKNKGINILIKFNDEELIVKNKNSTTMLEHLNVIKCNESNGQGDLGTRFT